MAENTRFVRHLAYAGKRGPWAVRVHDDDPLPEDDRLPEEPPGAGCYYCGSRNCHDEPIAGPGSWRSRMLRGVYDDLWTVGDVRDAIAPAMSLGRVPRCRQETIIMELAVLAARREVSQ
uniref:Uncharacterized protein n=1 Tax=viral metagenome TaxID=1070528 RepID=A0A6M3KR69_9ZZZZ